MGSSINVTTDIFKADPYAWRNVLANPLVGSTDDESKINSASTTKAFTTNGNAASNAQSNFYGGSYDFDKVVIILNIHSRTPALLKERMESRVLGSSKCK